jgi:bacterial leucyl aminopeptidase
VIDMLNFSRPLAIGALALASAYTGAALAAAPRQWITVGDPAYQLLREARPMVQAADSIRLPAAAARAADTIHVLQVSEAEMHDLSQAVHEKLRRCGGFAAHASRAEALAAVVRLRDERVAPAASTPSYAIDDGEIVNELLPQVQEDRVLQGIQKLSDYRNRYYNSPHGVAASDDLARAWQRMAGNRTDVSVRQVKHGWPQKSVVMTIRGSRNPEEIVVIGGHLDSITPLIFRENSRSPGADDDASGVASLSEVARVLLESGYRPKRTIEFMAYAAEEVGLLGSADIAKTYADASRNVVGVMQLDMTNYQGGAEDIVLIGDYTSAAQNQFVVNLASTYLPSLNVSQSLCGYACSDHASWTANGYASSFPFEAVLGQDNPHIHTKGDTLAKSGGMASHAVKFSRLALAFLVELGSDASAAAQR